MTERPELVMSFDPKTIEHLGVKMYSHLPNAIAELIANAYDACTTKDISSSADFTPFGNLRGFKGRSKALEPRTTRWLLKGPGLHIA